MLCYDARAALSRQADIRRTRTPKLNSKLAHIPCSAQARIASQTQRALSSFDGASSVSRPVFRVSKQVELWSFAHNLGEHLKRLGDQALILATGKQQINTATKAIAHASQDVRKATGGALYLEFDVVMPYSNPEKTDMIAKVNLHLRVVKVKFSLRKLTSNPFKVTGGLDHNRLSNLIIYKIIHGESLCLQAAGGDAVLVCLKSILRAKRRLVYKGVKTQTVLKLHAEEMQQPTFESQGQVYVTHRFVVLPRASPDLQCLQSTTPICP